MVLPRRDPLKSLQIYKGGFDMKDSHYWSSVAFTGVWAFGMALICLTTGIASAVFWSWNKGRAVKSARKSHFDILPGLYCFCILQFSIIAITSSGVVLWGTYQSEKEIKKSTDIIVSEVDKVVNQIHHAVVIIKGTMSPLMNDLMLNTIQDACDRLNASGMDLQSSFREGKEKFYKGFKKMKTFLTCAAATIPMVILTGLVAIMKMWCRVLRMSSAVMAIVLCASWTLSGICFILSNVTTDACEAMKDYERNPENSSFSKVLPCLRSNEATDKLNVAKSTIKNLVGQMNGAIDLVNGREEMMRLEYANGSFGITLKHFCDPFGPPPDFKAATCLANQSNFSTFETDYEKYRCAEDVLLHCFEANTPIPKTYYTQFIVMVSETKEVIKLLPSLYDIMTCAFIRKAFHDITANHCSALQAAFNTLWIAFASASFAMMSIQVMWVLISRHLNVKEAFKLYYNRSSYDYSC
ncbi:hypothetical protein KP509_04G054400 [Ceratopteris richardii]|nr:hypothetical protein KP509_04G054400 [Ceratopteris richardii]